MNELLLPTRPVDSGGSAGRTAVVGADGFIGRHLTAALVASGARVTAYTRQHELCWPDDETAPEIVFYLATSVTPTLAEQHPEWVTADHLRFADLLRRLARSARPPTVVFTSSAGTVYDTDASGPCSETAATRPTCRYGVAKRELERLLLDYARDVPAVILRLSNVYGPGQRVDKSQGVLAYWLSAVVAGRPLQLIGDPTATRDYVYIDDLVDCMLRVAARSPGLAADGPLVVNVASGVSTPLAELLSTVESVVGRELAVERVPGRAVDRRNTCLDVRRAVQALGWRSRTSLTEGITAMWQHQRQRPDQRASTAAGVRGGTLAYELAT